MNAPLPAWADALRDLIIENLDGLGAVADQIGDELINVVPPLPQANSGYGIVYHCTQVVQFWAGSVIGGERIPRNRAAPPPETTTPLVDRVPALMPLRRSRAGMGARRKRLHADAFESSRVFVLPTVSTMSIVLSASRTVAASS